MNEVWDLARWGPSVINTSIHFALRRGESICIADNTVFRWPDFGQEPLYCHPNVMFQLFEGVFEEYPVEYVRNQVEFDSPDGPSTFWWCAQYWQRTRDLMRAWPTSYSSLKAGA